MAASFAPVGAASANEARAREVPGEEDRGAPGAARGGGGAPALQLAGGGDGQQGRPGPAHRQHRRGQGPSHLPGRRAALGGGDGGPVARRRAQRPERAPRRPGAALVAHPGVDMVSFTGGVPTGRAVMAAAAASTKPVVLELGGNDPAILAPDVVVDEALADKIVGATFVTSGQVCMAIKRLYVPEERTSDVVEALGARLSGRGGGGRPGRGGDHGAGALRVRCRPGGGHARGGRAPGGQSDQAVAGARGGPGRGRLLRPPGARRQPADHGAHRDHEQFAPALPVVGYRSLDHAVEMANDTEFGLCASVWSNDVELAASVAGRLEAGTVFVNAHGMSAMDPSAPMGGWKSSGFGVELGPRACGPSPAPRCCSPTRARSRRVAALRGGRSARRARPGTR